MIFHPVYGAASPVAMQELGLTFLEAMLLLFSANMENSKTLVFSDRTCRVK